MRHVFDNLWNYPKIWNLRHHSSYVHICTYFCHVKYNCRHYVKFWNKPNVHGIDHELRAKRNCYSIYTIRSNVIGKSQHLKKLIISAMENHCTWNTSICTIYFHVQTPVIIISCTVLFCKNNGLNLCIFFKENKIFILM